jgi:hypothetical protein
MSPAKRKLKVYQAPFGFYDSVVAASSQTAALRAWGSHQNLFAEGIAHVTDDPKAIETALAQPEIPLRRVIGSDAAFELEPSVRPKAPKPAKGEKAPKAKATKPTPKPKPPPPDRSDLDAAEASLKRLEEGWVRRKAELARRRAELEAHEAAAEQSYREDRKFRRGAMEVARQAFAKAGGRT